MLQFGYKKERVVAYYHRMILEIVNGMELDVPDNVRTGYTLTEIRRIHDMNKKGHGKCAWNIGEKLLYIREWFVKTRCKDSTDSI